MIVSCIRELFLIDVAMLCSCMSYDMKALMLVSSSYFKLLLCVRQSFLWLIFAAYPLVVSVSSGLGVVFCGGFK